MRKLKNCSSVPFNSGVSKCPPDWGKMKGAILVERGQKLPADITRDKLEEMVHADRPGRAYGIITFCEYAPNGGDVATSAVGYGPEKPTGINARRDEYTLDNFYPELHAAFASNLNKSWGAYFFDEDGKLYGTNDGTDVLAPFAMANVYSNATPHPTSSAASTMSVSFAHENAKESIIKWDYLQLDFNPLDQSIVLGLTQVKVEPTTKDGNAYKIFEPIGGNDLTATYGPLIAAEAEGALVGATAATYNAADNTLTVTGGALKLAAPSVLFEKGIKGIEQL